MDEKQFNLLIAIFMTVLTCGVVVLCGTQLYVYMVGEFLYCGHVIFTSTIIILISLVGTLNLIIKDKQAMK